MKRDIPVLYSLSRFRVIILRELLNKKTFVFGHLSDLELLEQLCSSTDDDICYAEFVGRFIDDIRLHCSTVCKKRELDTHIGGQIAHEIFERVRKYKSFKRDNISIPNHREAILIYLKRISVSLFNDYHKENQRKDVPNKSYFEDIFEAGEGLLDGADLKSKRDISVYLFRKLNKKEQKVILADIEHKKFQRYLPDDVTEELCLTLNIKKDAIRKIRERAKQKLMGALKDLNEN